MKIRRALLGGLGALLSATLVAVLWHGQGSPPEQALPAAETVATDPSHLAAAGEAAAGPSGPRPAAAPAPQSRREIEAPAARLEVVVDGAVVRRDDERPVAGAKVMLFSYRTADRWKDRSEEALEPAIAWTDGEGRFRFRHRIAPGEEWRGSLMIWADGFRLFNVPLLLEPGHDLDLEEIALVPATDSEDDAASPRGVDLFELMQLLETR